MPLKCSKESVSKHWQAGRITEQDPGAVSRAQRPGSSNLGDAMIKEDDQSYDSPVSVTTKHLDEPAQGAAQRGTAGSGRRGAGSPNICEVSTDPEVAGRFFESRSPPRNRRRSSRGDEGARAKPKPPAHGPKTPRRAPASATKEAKQHRSWVDVDVEDVAFDDLEAIERGERPLRAQTPRPRRQKPTPPRGPAPSREPSATDVSEAATRAPTPQPETQLQNQATAPQGRSQNKIREQRPVLSVPGAATLEDHWGHFLYLDESGNFPCAWKKKSTKVPQASC